MNPLKYIHGKNTSYYPTEEVIYSEDILFKDSLCVYWFRNIHDDNITICGLNYYNNEGGNKSFKNCKVTPSAVSVFKNLSEDGVGLMMEDIKNTEEHYFKIDDKC
ncbi:hypothetical protein FUA48_08730 [Flavobacterium alkalisoli]|uniref:Uncharacterized protein n=1 Tax=Flavobacterium alkalisoli TaxID=2602769 RepID=A0A5B9FU97_9FLAO|nr:hypothetical protein [Flavobacterium alkalisoli]QEE49666.1 hypothetical protein FUA48_08730 [Flavobacterium alkalisoli]